MSGKAVPSSGNTGPRDFSAEVHGQFTGPPAPPDARRFWDRFTVIPDSGITALNCSRCPGDGADTWEVGYHPSLDVLIEQALAHDLAVHGGS